MVKVRWIDQMATARSYSTAPNTGILILDVFAERHGAHLGSSGSVEACQSSDSGTLVANHRNILPRRIPSERSPRRFSLTSPMEATTWKSVRSDSSALTRRRPESPVRIRVQQNIEIVLHRDPAAINLDIADTLLSVKARKAAKRAVSALKSGNLKDAQKELEEAYSSAPTSPELNFLLGYLYFQKKDFTQAGTYLGTATTLNPHNAQALTLLGRTGLEKQDYPAARSALEQAVLADAENWLPHNLLADTYLHEKNYAKARDEAQVAIAKGKNAASPAQLVLGEALVNLGQSQQGVQALKIFLDASPQHPVAGQVRNLIAEIEGDASNPASAESALQTKNKLTGVDPLLALPAPKLSVKSWQPPGIDEIKLSVAPDVACPTEKVIAESGKRVQELVEDVTRFAAVEDLFHQALDEYGNPVRTETRKFNYVAAISEPQPGYLAVDEYRADKLSLTGYPDNIASTGFITLALPFPPSHA